MVLDGALHRRLGIYMYLGYSSFYENAQDAHHGSGLAWPRLVVAYCLRWGWPKTLGQCDATASH